MMRWIWSILLLLPGLSQGGTRWPSVGKGEIYGGVGVEYRRWRLDDQEVASRRWDFRASYGARGWLDLKARVGMAQLVISTPGSGWTDLEAAYRPLLGAGARLRLFDLLSLVTYVDAEGLLFRPSGATVYTTGADTLRSEVHYRPWGEYFVGFHVAIPSWGIYGGVVFQGVATECERRLIEGGKTLEERRESYRSGGRWTYVLGRRLEMGKGFQLQAEVWASSDVFIGKAHEDIAVRVELVQRYVPEREPF